ncbi:unnamed protein product [Lota lota]
MIGSLFFGSALQRDDFSSSISTGPVRHAAARVEAPAPARETAGPSWGSGSWCSDGGKKHRTSRRECLILSLLVAQEEMPGN